MPRFEDAIVWMLNGGRARRAGWAKVPMYTQATPPLTYHRTWRVWQQPDVGGFIQGWGGQMGMQLDPADPIMDGTYYTPSDDDRIASDWELIEKK